MDGAWEYAMNNSNENTANPPVAANPENPPANEPVEQAVAPTDAPAEPAADSSEPVKA